MPRSIQFYQVHRVHAESRSGVILLVVLGMLTLFSMLGVSYLVFTSRQRSAAFSISRAESSKIDSDSLLNDALDKILVGSNGPSSALWGHDLLGDLYGMRDAIRGEVTIPGQFVDTSSTDMAPALLLDNSFLRFPTELFRPPATASLERFPYRRHDSTSGQRHYPGPVTAPTNAQDFFAFDDELAGRLLTFDAGPLAGLTMQVVRYFGDHRGVTANRRAQLSGQMVVDLRPHLTKSVTIDGDSRSLAEWFTTPGFSAHRLIYDQVIGALPSTASPYGDFYLNGRILNGPGLGWDVTRSAYDFSNPTFAPASSGTVFNINEVVSTTLDIVNGFSATAVPVQGSDFAAGGTDVSVALQGNYANYRLPPTATAASPVLQYLQDLPPGDVDEPYDAPDFNNLWLSYFPDNDALGVSAPSFVRPEVLNWLVNQQSGALATLPVDRLRSILYALQRSTLRPLPFINDPRMPANASLRAAGVQKFAYTDFTGSNQSVGLNAPVNIASNNQAYLAQRIIEMAQALAGRDFNGDGFIDSWDVDNDGDGHVDSVWTDPGLPLTEAANGQLIKPLVAYMVEDLGGRVNVNLSGNWAQAKDVISTEMNGALQHTGAVQVPATTTTATVSPVSVPSVPTPGNIHRTRNIANGFGFGPAEIDIRALFGPTYAGPIGTRLFRGPQALVRNRLNLHRVGGVDYIAPGELVDPLAIVSTGPRGNDIRGILRNPTRPNLHDFSHPFGLPLDTFGRSSVGIGVDGGLVVSRSTLPVANGGERPGDASDDPYEFVFDRASSQPDNPFTYEELEAILRFNNLDRDLLGSRLVDLINTYHNDPSGTPDQLEELRRVFAESITTHSNSATGLVGTLPSEWRNSLTGSTSAAAPQRQLVGSITKSNGTATNQQLNALIWELLPTEVRGGGKFNLNRPFGDGFDNDANGVIDDPNEVNSGGEVFLRQWDGANAQFTRWSTAAGDVTPGIPGFNSRAYFARHLYTLAMLLTRDVSEPGNPTAFAFPVNPALTIGPLERTARRDPAGGPNRANTVEEEIRAMKIAQWAINVVDFRDSDAIMSKFDYDIDPFDGWDITQLNIPSLGARNTHRTVWGMENPELTLEESLALHDRRVRDTADDDGPATKRLVGPDGSATIDEPTPDQWRLPLGSLFLELRSTRSPIPAQLPANELDGLANATGFPTELYTNVGTPTNPIWQLDLGRQAPDSNPVWRVAISQAHHVQTPTPEPDLSPDLLMQPVGSGATLSASGFIPPVVPVAFVANRDSITLQPEQPNFFGPLKDTTARPDRGIDRVIWFAAQDPDSDDDGICDAWVPRDSAAPGKIFYNRSGVTPYLQPGQYAVVGPRQITPFGQMQTHSVAGQTHDANDRPQVPYAQYESTQRIVLTPTSIARINSTGTTTTPLADTGATADASIRPVLGIVAAANRPQSWTALPVTRTIGVNISEPVEITGGNPVFTTPRQYYPPPTRALDSANGFPVDSWRDYDGAGVGALPNTPFDTASYAELEQTLDSTTFGLRTGTYEHYKTAYLQRLADPTQPYHIENNPYISVDYITLDLTLFNGSMDNDASLTDTAAMPLWPDDQDVDPFNTAPDEKLATRYKTGQSIDNPVGGTFENLVHSVNTYAPDITATPSVGADIPYFKRDLKVDIDANLAAANRVAHSSTLGYLNHTFGPRWQQGDGTATAPALASMTPYVGIPYNNFAIGAMWLNRDYVSPNELMWVPTTSAGTFASQFATVPTGGPDPYLDTDNTYVAPTPPALDKIRYDYKRQFPHLWNYFSSNANDFSRSPNFWRVLEYMEVPPPYDFEADFVSPDSNIYNATTDPVFSGNFNYSTFAPAGPNPPTGNPNTWTSAGTAASDQTWNRAAGSWNATTPGAGQTNGFWANDMAVEFMRPPFSFRSGLYRNGLINLNTIRSNQVYGALTYGFATDAERTIVMGRTAFGAPGGPLTAGFGALRDQFLNNRRGYAMASIPAAPSIQLRAGLHHEFPTQFAGVFEASNNADIAPDLGTATNLRRIPLESSLLRKDSTATRPLLQRDPATVSLANSPERSIVHETLGMTRLSNLSSGQSNVYAVWVTVGLFEVDANTLTVGREAGIDTGQNQRLRSFHIIDRSVPVRYEPGVVNNAKDVVQLSRILD